MLCGASTTLQVHLVLVLVWVLVLVLVLAALVGLVVTLAACPPPLQQRQPS
jgi:hypothetical protein